jgi:glycosyltransferase involved in cell wall biosynthesis
MACGLPCVSFDCPHGPAQIITDGVDGFLIKDRNHSFFAEKLCALIESDELRKKMGHAAVLSSQRYAAPQIMAEWMNLFKELMNKKTI